MTLDWAGCQDSRKSTAGYDLMLNGAAILWKSKRQNVVALLSAEAEIMAASLLVQNVMYIRKLLEKLGFLQSGHTPIVRIIGLALLGVRVLLVEVIGQNTLIFVVIFFMRQSKMVF